MEQTHTTVKGFIEKVECNCGEQVSGLGKYCHYWQLESPLETTGNDESEKI